MEGTPSPAPMPLVQATNVNNHAYEEILKKLSELDAKICKVEREQRSMFDMIKEFIFSFTPKNTSEDTSKNTLVCGNKNSVHYGRPYNIIKQEMDSVNYDFEAWSKRCPANWIKCKLNTNKITRIESRIGYDIDKIGLCFTDGNIKYYGTGKDGGNEGKPIKLKGDEKIINIKHYYNGWNMGKRIIFKTNYQEYIIEGEKGKGVEQKNITSEFNVTSGKILTGLHFVNGKLVGIEEE